MEHSLTGKKDVRLGIWVHVLAWVILFSFPFLVSNRSMEGFRMENYVHHTFVLVLWFVAFYLNYLELIPKFLFREKTTRYFVYNIILIVVFALIMDFGQEWIRSLEMGGFRPHPAHPGPPRIFFVAVNAVWLAFMVSLAAIIRIGFRWSKMEMAHREAERQRTEAELTNLRNQLNPHFLLNTLNNIYALIAFDSDKAQDAVAELSKLLRYMLYDNQQMYVSLAKEADFIRNYIELMRIRLPQNVVVETNLNINKDSRTPIAPLIFISLIENAFKHGISPTDASFIRIEMSEGSDKVFCAITNSNFPKTAKDKSGSGIGLQQVFKRLELLYHNHYHWEKGVSDDGKSYYSRLTIEV